MAFRHFPFQFLLDVFYGPGLPVAAAGNDLPSQLFRCEQSTFPAMGQKSRIPLVEVFFAPIPLIPLGQQLLGNFRRHVQIQHQIRPGDAQLFVFKILSPAKIAGPFLSGELGQLIHQIGGGVAVCQQQHPRLIVPPPVHLIGGVAVHRIESGGRIGVDVLGPGAEIPLQIHFYQSRGRGCIVGKRKPAHRAPFLQRFIEPLCLGAFSAAVQSL